MTDAWYEEETGQALLALVGRNTNMYRTQCIGLQPQTNIRLQFRFQLNGFQVTQFYFQIKGALDNFNLIPNFFSKKLRFLYH